MFWQRLGLILAAVTGLSACSTTSLGTSESNDQLVLTDASNRAISAVRVDIDPQGRRVKPRRVLCAEPSPDIARAVSSAIEASLGAKAQKDGVASASIDAAFNRSVTESIAQLGSRLATIQLLRDELSDLCRAYANGAVSSITYTLRLSRLDKKMITLLTSEASAGALSRALVGIDTAGRTSGALPSIEQLAAMDTKVAEAAIALADAGKQVANAKDEVTKATDATSKETAAKKLADAELKLQGRMKELHDRTLERLATSVRQGTQASASASVGNSGLPAQTVQVADLRAIHKAYLDDDDAGTLLDACLTSMEDNAIDLRGPDPQLAAVRNKLDNKEKELARVDAEYDAARRKAAASRTQQDIDAADKLLQQLRTIKIELDQLERDAVNLTGAFDRTSLLKFCRERMDRIVNVIEFKMRSKVEAESTARLVEVCKLALADPKVTESVKSQCVSATIGRTDRPRF